MDSNVRSKMFQVLDKAGLHVKNSFFVTKDEAKKLRDSLNQEAGWDKSGKELPPFFVSKGPDHYLVQERAMR